MRKMPKTKTKYGPLGNQIQAMLERHGETLQFIPLQPGYDPGPDAQCHLCKGPLDTSKQAVVVSSCYVDRYVCYECCKGLLKLAPQIKALKEAK